MNQEDLEKSNRSKYGNKSSDLIARNYMNGIDQGHSWCGNNVLRYIERFIKPGSSKGMNYTDLLKSRDYLNRMIEEHEKAGLNINNKEKIE